MYEFHYYQINKTNTCTVHIYNRNNIFPYPFSMLDIRESKSSIGKYWLFFLSVNNVLVGYKFKSGYRCYGLRQNTNVINGEFFIECRNSTYSSKGLLAAMVKKNLSVGFHSSTLILTQSMTYNKNKEGFSLLFHELKRTQEQVCYRNIVSNEENIHKYFTRWKTKNMSNVDVVYLNWIKKEQLQQHCALQCEFEGPDRILTSFKPIPFHMRFNSEFRDGIERVKLTKHKKKKYCPSRLSNSFGRTKVYVMNEQNMSDIGKTYSRERYHLIPFEFKEKLITFAPITLKEYKELLLEYGNNGSYASIVWSNKIKSLMQSKDRQSITVLNICANNNKHGFIVGITKDVSTMERDCKEVNENIDGLHVMTYENNPNDFELTEKTISVFRGYIWPFKNKLQHDHYEACSKTFTSKGLVRNCTTHNGNFEMIGPRKSKQSTGSLISLPEDVNKHQYNRATMNSSMLPLIKGLLNLLKREAETTMYTCGEALMSLYKQVLFLRHEEELCKQILLTQKHFNNSGHIDKDAHLGKLWSNIVLNSELNRDSHRIHIKNYLRMMKERCNEKLPKSTTCCWCLREFNTEFCLKQYFIGIDLKFAFDLSSSTLNNSDSVGATFFSSIFFHCTSIPVWIDSKGMIHLKGPMNMYNFSWGRDGGSS